MSAIQQHVKAKKVLGLIFYQNETSDDIWYEIGFFYCLNRFMCLIYNRI